MANEINLSDSACRYTYRGANMHNQNRQRGARWQARKVQAKSSGVKLTSDFGFGAWALGAVRRLPGFNQRRLHVLRARSKRSKPESTFPWIGGAIACLHCCVCSI